MSRPRLDRCKRGHLLAETRRTRADGSSHDCRACHNILEARRKRALERPVLPSGGQQPALRLDFAPMEAFLVGRELTLSTIFNGHSLRRWRTDGIPVLSADELACRFGKHPVEDWGAAFYQEELVV